MKSQQKELRGTSPIVGAIQKLGSENSGSRKDQTCPKCGRSPSHDRQQCPARTAVCRKCKKRGHFQVVCRSPANVSGLQSRKLSQEDNAFMGALKGKKQPTEQWEVILKVNSRPVKFHIDTGAEVTVVSTRTWQKIGKPSLSASDRTLRCPDEHTLKVKGMFKGTLKTSERQTEQPVYIVDNLQTELLVRPSIESLKLITQVAAVSTNEPVARFPSLFTGHGQLERD